MPLIMGVPERSRGLARPLASIARMSGWVDCHVTEFVISCVELSENLPIALNGTGVPLLMSGLSGLMVTLRSTGAFPAAGTVTLVQPLVFPLESVAAMFAMPASLATHEPG